MRRRLSLLLALAALAVVLLLLWGVGERRVFRIEAPVEPEKPAKISTTEVAGTTVTEKPQFNGEDGKGRTWQLNAEEATQSGSVSESVVGLEKASGWWQGQSGRVEGSADHGDYWPNDNKLSLKGNVVLENSATVIHSPALKADLASHEVSGTSGVSLTRVLNNGVLHVQAREFVVDLENQKATLWGNVRTRLEPK